MHRNISKVAGRKDDGGIAKVREALSGFGASISIATTYGRSKQAQETSEEVLPVKQGAEVNPNESWIEESEADPVEPGEPAPGTVDPETREQAAEMLRMSLAALQTGMAPGAVVNNGTVALGIHNLGHLNYSGTSVRYLPNRADALIPGCPCEGWGVADATSRVTGYFGIGSCTKFDQRGSRLTAEVGHSSLDTATPC